MLVPETEMGEGNGPEQRKRYRTCTIEKVNKLCSKKYQETGRRRGGEGGEKPNNCWTNFWFWRAGLNRKGRPGWMEREREEREELAFFGRRNNNEGVWPNVDMRR